MLQAEEGNTVMRRLRREISEQKESINKYKRKRIEVEERFEEQRVEHDCAVASLMMEMKWLQNDNYPLVL